MIQGSKIFLVGMPGSGKSTLGIELASNLGLEFLDLDNEIEKYHGSNIKEIFTNEGEDNFRSLDKLQLEKSLYEFPAFVMATGGGTPCFFDNLELMKASGLVVFLEVPSETLNYRLTKGEGIQNRPLLNTVKEGTVLDELKKKLMIRRPYYLKAHITIEGDEISVSEILEALEKHH